MIDRVMRVIVGADGMQISGLTPNLAKTQWKYQEWWLTPRQESP